VCVPWVRFDAWVMLAVNRYYYKANIPAKRRVQCLATSRRAAYMCYQSERLLCVCVYSVSWELVPRVRATSCKRVAAAEPQC